MTFAKSNLLLAALVALVACVASAHGAGVRGLKKKKTQAVTTTGSGRKLQKGGGGGKGGGKGGGGGTEDPFGGFGEIFGGGDDDGGGGGDLEDLVTIIELLQDFQCFSKFNTIDTLAADNHGENGNRDNYSQKRMDQIAVGDYVRDSATSFSRVISLGHVDRYAKAQFLSIATDGNVGGPLEITSKHMIFVSGKGAVPADRVEVGDILSNGGGVVRGIGAVSRRGVYAPITASGKVVVSGIQSSSYATSFHDSILLPPHLQHVATHFFFAPQRAICAHYDFGLCRDETHDADGYTTWFSFVIKARRVLDDSFDFSNSARLQLLFALLAVPVLSVLYAIEQLLSLSPPSLVLLLALGTTTATVCRGGKTKASAKTL